MLSFGLPYLRNFLEQPWYKRILNKSAFLTSQLLHYIPPILFYKDIGKQDVEFIVFGGRFFVENFNDKSDPIFLILSDLILELYELIQSEDNLEVKWIFPDDVRMLVSKFREENNRAGN
jgi:hypothetical protein